MIYHYNKDVYESTLHWFGTDTYDLHLKNLKYNYKELNDLGFIDKTIEYKINSMGFRCEEFESYHSIIFLGCSCTFGLGLHLYDTWPYLVSKNLNLRSINLSISGGSNDSAFRVFNQYYQQLAPKIVVILSPNIFRKEVIISNYSKNYLVNNNYKNNTLWNEWLSSDSNGILNRKKNILAIEYFCLKFGIKFLQYEVEDLIGSTKDLARDLLHPGKITNKLFAERVINDIERTGNN